MKLRITLTTLAIALFMLVFSGSAFAQKIGYVDLQAALNKVEDGKKAKARLKRDFAKKQKKLDAKQKAVKKKKEALEAQAMMLSDDAKQKKAMELQKEMYELQQLYLQLQGDLSKAEAKATQKIFKKMGKILQKIGKEKGYDLILEKTESSVLYAKDGMNITAELVKRYNSK